jgi:hypothetical protein
LVFAHSQRWNVRSLAATAGTGFLDRLFDGFTGFPGAFLNPANQFVVLALDVLEIVIRELGPLLLQLALGDVPVALDFEFIHKSPFHFWFSFAANVTAKIIPQSGCGLMLRLGLAFCHGA